MLKDGCCRFCFSVFNFEFLVNVRLTFYGTAFVYCTAACVVRVGNCMSEFMGLITGTYEAKVRASRKQCCFWNDTCLTWRELWTIGHRPLSFPFPALFCAAASIFLQLYLYPALHISPVLPFQFCGRPLPLRPSDVHWSACMVAGWRSGNVVLHIRRVPLVLRLLTTFDGYIIPVFIQVTQAHSAWPSLRG